MLQWLDGNLQVNQVVNLATTNFPEQLDRRLIARPRRFDRIHRIDSPEAGYRDAYFARKLPDLPPEERRRWAMLSEGLPFAALAELIISVCCLGNDLEESIGLLRRLDHHNPSSAEFASPGWRMGTGSRCSPKIDPLPWPTSRNLGGRAPKIRP